MVIQLTNDSELLLCVIRVSTLSIAEQMTFGNVLEAVETVASGFYLFYLSFAQLSDVCIQTALLLFKGLIEKVHFVFDLVKGW